MMPKRKSLNQKLSGRNRNLGEFCETVTLDRIENMRKHFHIGKGTG